MFRYGLEEKLAQARQEKIKLQDKVEKLWKQVMEEKPTLSDVNESNNKKLSSRVSSGPAQAPASAWSQFITIVLCKTLEVNAKKYMIDKLSVAKSKALVKAQLESASKTVRPSTSQVKDAQIQQIGEDRYALIQTLARIVSRNALNDGRRKAILQIYIASKQHKLLLVYGDDEFKRKEAEKLRKQREELLQQQRRQLMIQFVKAVKEDIVHNIIETGLHNATKLVYDHWWMLDQDATEFCSPQLLAEVEKRFYQARNKWNMQKLRRLFRRFALIIRVRMLEHSHSQRLIIKYFRKMSKLYRIIRTQMKFVLCTQKLIRCFLFRKRLEKFIVHQRNSLILADAKYNQLIQNRLPKYLHTWKVSVALHYTELRCIHVVSERAFLKCFYIWKTFHGRSKLQKVQLNQQQTISCVQLQSLTRGFLTRRRIVKFKAKIIIRQCVLQAIARRKVAKLRSYRRRFMEYENNIARSFKIRRLKKIFSEWKLKAHIIVGLYRMSSAYKNRILRKGMKSWKTFAALKTEFLAKYAIKIQSFFRMTFVLMHVLNYYRWRRNMSKLQGLVRRHRCMAYFAYHIFYYRKAKQIQRMMRGWYTRNHLDRSRIKDIHYAASSNNYNKLLFYIERRPDLITVLDSEGNSALHNAAKNACKRTLKLLMRSKLLDPNQLNAQGYSPLHLVIMSSAVSRDECCLYMLERGFNEDQLTSEGKSCVLLAAETSHIIILKKLLEDGHETNVPDNNGLTPLQAACIAGSYPCVKALLENDALVNQPGQHGTYPVHDCVTGGHVDVLQALLEYQADVNVIEPTYRQTPLMWACQVGLADFARSMILYHADTTARDITGKTAAHYAATTNTSEIYEVLREADVDFDALDYEGSSPLHMAAFYNAFDYARHLLEGGAYPSWQSETGDQPAHIAARYNHLETLKVICEYDEHIGRPNYAHQTPLGVAKFYSSLDVQKFLETHYRVIETVDTRNEIGAVWWDKAIDDVTNDWEMRVSSSGERWYVNKVTGEISLTPPVLSVDKVATIAQNAELPVQRRVSLVKEGATLTRHAYYKDYQAQKAEISLMSKEYRSATIIICLVRRKLASIKLHKLKHDHHRKIKILRFIKRHVKGFMRWKQEKYSEYAKIIQHVWRGYHLRYNYYIHPYGLYWQQREHRAKRVLRFQLWNVWKEYKKREHFQSLMVIANVPRSPQEWIQIMSDVRQPIRTVGLYEEYRYPNTLNVYFYHHTITGVCTFEKPKKIIAVDEFAAIESEQIKKFGATLRRIDLATKLQALWRGYQVRNYSNIMNKAMELCAHAEERYLSQPEVDNNLYNYALYCFTMQQNIERARMIFTESLRRMQWRGPDIPFVLYSYAVFALISHDEEFVEIQPILERARRAEEERMLILRTKYAADDNKKGSELVIDKQFFAYGKVFDLANLGFFRAAAIQKQNIFGWEAYAMCRFLVYSDFSGSFNAFMEAFKYDPTDESLRKNFEVMLTYFYGPSKEKHKEVIRETQRLHAEKDAAREELRRLARLEAKRRFDAASRIQSWYSNVKAAIIHKRFTETVKDFIKKEVKVARRIHRKQLEASSKSSGRMSRVSARQGTTEMVNGSGVGFSDTRSSGLYSDTFTAATGTYHSNRTSTKESVMNSSASNRLSSRKNKRMSLRMSIIANMRASMIDPTFSEAAENLSLEEDI